MTKDELKERADETIEATQEDEQAEALDAVPAAEGEISSDTPEETDSEPQTELSAEEVLEQLRAESATNLEGWQRAQAEFANYKKRSQAERERQVIFTGGRIVEKLLSVLDDFNRALEHLPEDLKDNEWIDGVRITQRKLYNVIEDEGVKEITVERGDTFDPSIHEAVSHEDSEEFSENQIIAELQKGYRLGERVLRPALVRVAR